METAPQRRGRPKKGESSIDRASIVQAAWQVVDEHGFSGLSTRAIAKCLNVQSPALYWHVSNKDELLSLMIESVLQDSIADAEGKDWRDWFKEVACKQRDLLLAHRDAGIILSLAAPSSRTREELFPKLIEPLIANGLPFNRASAAAGAMASLVLGWVIFMQQEGPLEMIEAFMEPTEGFETAIDLVIAGLQT